MELAITVDQAQHILRSTPFTRSLGLIARALADGECVIEVPFQNDFERPDRIINGGVFMIAADVAMWLAIMTRLGPDKRTVTTNMQTAFLNAAMNENILCTARVLKWGSRLIYGDAECTSLQARRLAHHTMTYIRL